ncbi:MAG TPA: ATP-binding protein [Planctomycetota bacterium]|nr:ATP-binding protein [Planctomycetota bacterium]
MSAREGHTPGEGRTAMLTLPSNPEHMKLVRALVGAAAEVVGFVKPDVNCLCLAVDEACTNVIRHAYDGDYTRPIVLELRMLSDRLEVTLRDYGKKADPARIKPRELHDIRPGGLGVHFIREIMDEVVYDVSVDVGTELRMMKLLGKK